MSMKLALTPHPDSRSSAISAIAVEILRSGVSLIDLRYVATGEVRNLAAAPPGLIERADELWRHTCFEAFLWPAGGVPYCEFNFAPSRQWAAYQFEDWRRGMHPLDGFPAPGIEVSRDPSAFRLDARITLGGVTRLPGNMPWRLAVTAIIETTEGEKSYWSLAHPQGKPDFHHADNFALTLPAETS